MNFTNKVSKLAIAVSAVASFTSVAQTNTGEELLYSYTPTQSLATLSTESGSLAEKFDGAIDLAVWVQPAVIDRLNAKGVNAEQYIDEMVNAWAEKANTTMTDSGVSSEFRLVYAGVTQNVPDTAPVTSGDALSQVGHYSIAWSIDGTIERFVMRSYSPDRTVFIVDKDTASLGFVIGSAVVVNAVPGASDTAVVVGIPVVSAATKGISGALHFIISRNKVRKNTMM